ncbi:2327_t:CDS:2, partial [Acaulospora colombiana]
SESTSEITKMFSTLYKSSPVKKGQQSVAIHVRAEVAEHVVSKAIQDVRLEKFWELLDLKDRRLEFEEDYKGIHHKKNGCFVEFLNKLSSLVHKKFEEQEPIYFVKCENKPSPHPTESSCRPDFVAIRKSRDEAWEDKTVSQIFKDREWSHFEATGEIRSAGKTRDEAHLQAASYTNYLLQARPDLTHVLGIYVEEGGFRLALSNPCGIAYLNPLGWRNKSASAILCAWLTRLYDPFKDPIITRIAGPDDVTFSLRIVDTTYEGCRLINTGIAFGRRTTIFEGPDTDTEDDIVIKIQYIETDRRFSEPATLNHIHDQVPFPGVVRIKAQTTPFQEADKVIVKLEISENESDGTITTRTETRHRTCLVMVDRGMSLMTAETPQAALIAIYDLLEERSTFHRDISEGNALIRSKPSIATEAMEKKFKEMHFATSLLGEYGPDPKARRLQTPLLLIDFDMGEVLKDETEGEPKPRTTSKYLEDEILLEQFQHELRYDAESVFWLLLWWAIQAKPDVQGWEGDCIKMTHWNALTGVIDKDDLRFYYIEPFPEEVLHPAYQPLETLLRAMGRQLAGDHGLMESRRDPEYLHESFQRLVFDFLCEHGRKNSDFFILKKSRHLREVQKAETMNQPKVTGSKAGQDSKASRSQADSSVTKRGREPKDDEQVDEEKMEHGETHCSYGYSWETIQRPIEDDIQILCSDCISWTFEADFVTRAKGLLDTDLTSGLFIGIERLFYGPAHQPTSPPRHILPPTTMSVASESTSEITKMFSTLYKSSPVKKGQQSVAIHVREEVANHVVSKVIEDVDLAKFWELLDLQDKIAIFEKISKGIRRKNNECFVEYLNELSGIVHKKFKEQEPIYFVKCENKPSPHPTESSCRPDFVGIRKSRDEAWEDKTVSQIFKDREWSHFEATGEI